MQIFSNFPAKRLSIYRRRNFVTPFNSLIITSITRKLINNYFEYKILNFKKSGYENFYKNTAHAYFGRPYFSKSFGGKIGDI